MSRLEAPAPARLSQPDRPAGSRWPIPSAEGRPLIIGHRGASEDAPENTRAAFLLAREQGADGWESDWWLSKDDELIGLHDETTTRVTGVSKTVSQTSSAT